MRMRNKGCVRVCLSCKVAQVLERRQRSITDDLNFPRALLFRLARQQFHQSFSLSIKSKTICKVSAAALIRKTAHRRETTLMGDGDYTNKKVDYSNSINAFTKIVNPNHHTNLRMMSVAKNNIKLRNEREGICLQTHAFSSISASAWARLLKEGRGNFHKNRAHRPLSARLLDMHGAPVEISIGTHNIYILRTTQSAKFIS